MRYYLGNKTFEKRENALEEITYNFDKYGKLFADKNIEAIRFMASIYQDRDISILEAEKAVRAFEETGESLDISNMKPFLESKKLFAEEMRQIFFRGKSKKTDKWLYGSLESNIFSSKEKKRAFILDKNVLDSNSWEDVWEEMEDYEVNINSVGQWTGAVDSKGKNIYEKMQVKQKHNNKSIKGEVVFLDGSWVVYNYENKKSSPLSFKNHKVSIYQENQILDGIKKFINMFKKDEGTKNFIKYKDVNVKSINIMVEVEKDFKEDSRYEKYVFKFLEESNLLEKDIEVEHAIGSVVYIKPMFLDSKVGKSDIKEFTNLYRSVKEKFKSAKVSLCLEKFINEKNNSFNEITVELDEFLELTILSK